MATTRKARGGRTAWVNDFVAAERQLVVETTTGDIRVGDGVTPGGFGGKGILQRAKEGISDASFAAAGGSFGAFTPTYLNKLQQIVHLKDYWDPTSGDATAALNWALSKHRRVFIDPSRAADQSDRWVFAGTVAVGQVGQELTGAGPQASILRSSVAGLPLISVATGLNGVHIEGLHLQRAVAATVGGDGIVSPGVVSNVLFENNYIQDQWNGMLLRASDSGQVDKNNIIGSYNDCIQITNTNLGCRWNIAGNTLSSGNRHGIFVYATDGLGISVVSLGYFEKNDTFALVGNGIRIEGTVSTTISNVDIEGGFLGSTGASAIYLDTHYGYHSIRGIKSEQVGLDPTGRTRSTAPSGVGSGIELASGNLFNVTISDPYIATAAHNGISSYSDMTVVGGTIINCGSSGVAGFRNGVASYGGKADVVGVRIGNSAGASLSYGIWAADGSKVNSVGNDFDGVGVAPYNVVSNPTQIRTAGNKPDIANGVLRGGGPYSWPAIAAGATGQITFGVPGAEYGDKADATISIDPQGLDFTAIVSAPGVVKVMARNTTGASITLGSCSNYIEVQKRRS